MVMVWVWMCLSVIALVFMQSFCHWHCPVLQRLHGVLYDYDMIVPFLCNVMCLFYAVLLMRSFLFHMQSVFLLLSYPVSHILCCMLYFVSLSVTHFACNFGLSVASVNALSCYLLSFSVLSLSVLFSACNPVFLSLSCSAVLLLHQCMAVVVFLSLLRPALSLPFCVMIKYVSLLVTSSAYCLGLFCHCVLVLHLWCIIIYMTESVIMSFYQCIIALFAYDCMHLFNNMSN